ncbi:MAG: hypothetical protein CFK52_04340 [Chloracidobacterium sp. CP2_5A]|nr:MAG: hypothetical protein CFK52_04340 [Chloracidobacterium sp. CP2_5A]
MTTRPKPTRSRAAGVTRALSLACLALLLVASGGWRATRAETPAAADCFSLDDLAPDERARAETLFLALLDSEALYTVACDLKPMSGGYVRFQFDAAQPDLTDIEATRRRLMRFRCGDLFYADVLVFAAAYDGKRQAEGVVFNRRALERAIRAHAGYFAPFGVTPNAHPMDALKTVEHAERALRWRGYGYLFGYPDAAVDFFVAAGESQDATGKFVERDFLHIPSYARATGAFTWAVPKGHRETDAEKRLRAEAMAVLENYRARRAQLIGDGKPGVVALLRELAQRPGAKPAARP